jgi:hypothetical protein
MLYVFKSKAAAQVIMLQDLTQMLFDIIGKPLEKRGIFTPEQLPAAISHLEAAISEDAQIPTETRERNTDGDEVIRERLRLGQRAQPFLELLRAAQKAHKEVVWGV